MIIEFNSIFQISFPDRTSIPLNKICDHFLLCHVIDYLREPMMWSIWDNIRDMVNDHLLEKIYDNRI